MICPMLDGHSLGSKGRSGIFDDPDPEKRLAIFADFLVESDLSEEVWGGWPLCPRHPNRPMWATVNDVGRAVWRCEADSTDEAEVGRLAETTFEPQAS
jgi:hypothetical protein